MKRPEFPKDFLIGTATASYQVEGAAYTDGRTSCIWDDMALVPGKTYAGENGGVAADQYHRYKEDVALMADLGFQAYRFSVSWSRVLPHGGNEVNREGIEYYRSLIRELHSKGLKAACTIYHWDLPSELQAKGGWANRETAYRFEEYAEVLFRELGDEVDMWFTLNEPFCFCFLGYVIGNHAPGLQDWSLYPSVVHHANLAHGLALKKYREMELKAPIGIAWNPITPRPATKKPEDIQASLDARALNTEIYLGPVFGYGYPEFATKKMGMAFPVEEGDLEIISQPIDFYAINYYNERPVKADPADPRGFSDAPGWEKTTSGIGWPIDEMGLMRMLRWLNGYSKGLPVYISENGSAENDVLEADGRVHDWERIDYLGKHLNVCSEAIKEGIPLKGYFCWSFIDNYEWNFGYSKRFGIVYCDYMTMERYPKDSAYFLRDIIAGFGDY